MSETTRRAVLAGVAGAGAAAALAACGSGEDGGASDSGAGQAAGGAGAIGGGALARKADIPVGGGKIFKAEKVVVTQPEAGEYKAFSAVCTHAGCTVSSIKDGIIDCGCHGSQFSAADGSVKSGPASTPLLSRAIKVDGDNLVLG